MPRYWEERASWYAAILRMRHNLGADRIETQRAFHTSMSRPAPKLAPKAGQIATVVDRR